MKLPTRKINFLRIRSIRAVMSCAVTIGLVALSVAQASPGGLSPREELFVKTLGITKLVKGGFVQAHWMEDGNSFWWSEAGSFYKYDPMAKQRTALFDAERLGKALESVVGQEQQKPGVPFKDFTFLPGEKAIRFTVGQTDYILRLDTYEVRAQPKEAEEAVTRRTPRFIHKGLTAFEPPTFEQPSPDGRWLVGAKDGNLYLRSAEKDLTTPLTEGGVVDNGWELDYVEWSPDSKAILAAFVDERKVPRFPIVHWLSPDSDVESPHLPRADSPSPSITTYYIDLETKRKTPIGGDGLQTRGWRSDGSELLMTRIGLSKLDFIAFNPKTSVTRTLFTETTNTFFDPAASLYNSPNFTALQDNRRFLWLSERDGWNEIYLYGYDGKLIRQLTHEQHPVVRIVGVDERAGWVYYTAHGGDGRPYDTQLYRVSLVGGTPARLSEAPGQHDGSIYFDALGLPRSEGIDMSPSKQFFIDAHSDIDRPLRTELRKADGTLVEVLAVANADEAKALRPAPPEQFRVKAADGKTDIYGLLYKPVDLDPSKKYPVVELIYAGPQSTVVGRNYGGPRTPTAQAFANMGYVVFVVDGRGTPDRGKAFQDVVHLNFGRNEIPDHVAALKQVAANRPFMDMDRVGVCGGSFGGYFTLRAMLTAPDVYKVGVASSPATDLRDLTPNMQVYMGLPEEHKEAYDYASNVSLAAKLRGRLLIIHGTSDVNAPFSGTVRMIEALVRANKQFDFLMLPEQDHRFGADAQYRQLAQLRYFDEHLMGSPR